MANKYEESAKVINDLIRQDKLASAVEGSDKFFFEKSMQSITISQRLFELQEQEGLETSLWVINSAYYSMFFAATALLAKNNKRIKTDQGIHTLTYHALVHFFVNQNKKIEEYFINEYKEAKKEAEEILQISECKTEDFLKDFKFELSKRKVFTYDIGRTAERSKAETSLKMAKNFLKVIEAISL